MSKPYRTCPHCGAHLDSGEHCDCQDPKCDTEAAQEAGQEAGALATCKQKEPALLMPGA